MCKIVILTNSSNIKNFDKFSRLMAESLSDQRDGFGFVAQSKSGNFGVRTLKPLQYAADIETPAFCEVVTEHFGDQKSKASGAALFHGRISTNVIDLINTHPISRDNWYLIHNGVVNHDGEKYEQKTTNDSEHVLFNLINGGIDSVAKNLTGYYAAGAIDASGLLHVFRDETAPLFWARSKKLNTDIFATTEKLIEVIAKYAGERLIAQPLKSNIYLVYKNNKLIETREFKSRGFTYETAKYSRKSLGRDLKVIDSESFSYRDEYYRDYDYNDTSLVKLEQLNQNYTYELDGREISYNDFMSLEPIDQESCIIRLDGVIVDIDEYIYG